MRSEYAFENWPRRQRWFIRLLFAMMGLIVGQALGLVGIGTALLFAWIGPNALEWLFDPEAGGETA